MHKTKKITFNNREITVHEVTVAQVEAWEKALFAGDELDIHILDKIMDKPLPVSGLRFCVPELTDEDLKIAPSEIIKIYDAVEEVNPFFLQYVGKMAKLGSELMAKGADRQNP